MSTAIEALEAAATAARRAANCQDPNVYREALYALGRAYLDAHPAKQAAERIRVEGPVNPGEKHLRHRLRKPGETLEHYRIAMGWDKQP